MTAFAPIEAPFLTVVFKNWSFLLTSLLGVKIFVKTHEGPKKTSSSTITPGKKRHVVLDFYALSNSNFRRNINVLS